MLFGLLSWNFKGDVSISHHALIVYVDFVAQEKKPIEKTAVIQYSVTPPCPTWRGTVMLCAEIALT